MSWFTLSGKGWMVAPMARAPWMIWAVRSTRAALWRAFSGVDAQVTRPWLARRAAPRSARWLATSSPSSAVPVPLYLQQGTSPPMYTTTSSITAGMGSWARANIVAWTAWVWITAPSSGYRSSVERWRSFSVVGDRVPDTTEPSASTTTRSSSVIVSYGTDDGVRQTSPSA